mgnify:CR=1 FL=1
MPLKAYDNIEVETFSNECPLTPESLLDQLQPRMVKELRENRQPVNSGGAKTLVVRGKIIYYESADLASQIWGPLEEVIAIVELVDKASGSIIGRSYCVGRSTATTSQSVKAKADGLSEAVAKWIDRYRPVPKEKEKE